MLQRLLLCQLLIALAVLPGWSQETPLELFEQRIMPIFRSPKPSSCVQCHLASVDLKQYIRPSHEETFLSLRDQGLIDVESPGDSKILRLIRMGEEDRDLLAQRLTSIERQQELQAFGAWIAACCEDQQLVSKPPLAKELLAAPEVTDEIIRHGRKDRVLDSFVRNVWSQRMRCFPCHTPDEIDKKNTLYFQQKKRNRDFVLKYGARMNFFKKTPEQTMRMLINNSRKKSKKSLPMLNLDDPAQSLLLLKPTAKLPAKNEDGTFEKPSSLAPVSHMGGLKMHVDDVSYKGILTWIEDLAKVKQGQYASADDLPIDNWYPTKHVIRMKEIPESWPVMSRVQFFIHAKTDDGDGWDSDPLAFTQAIVTPRRFANGSLVVLRDNGGDGTAEDVEWDSGGVTLPAGDYLVKAYLDRGGKIEADPTAFLGADDYQGQIEISAEWKEGFKNAQVVSGSDLLAPAG